jgi:periplasmic protein TonB
VKSTLALVIILVDTALGAQQVYTVGHGVIAPVPTTKVRAEYTQEARDAGIEGRVVLEAVVQTDGTPTDIKVVRSLDSVHGLDEQAVKALTQWRFKPGTKDGEAVPVRLQFTFGFAL